MNPISELMHEEHRVLGAYLDAVHNVADAMDDISLPELRSRIDQVHDYLVTRLAPHATAEDEVLYPAVGWLLGNPQATATMTRDHVEIARLTAKLAALRQRLMHGYFGPVELRAVRAVLFSLDAVVRLHMAKEEEIYLPLLEERLTPVEARDLLKRMEAAEHHAGAALAAATA
jgi:iron-sulfur cluster repair protein YtfE (RIC family)